MRHIFDINMVQPGMKTEESIVDPRNRITLVAKGTELTADLIKRLKTRDIYEIAVDLDEVEKQKYQFDFNVIPTVNTSTIKGATATIASIDGIKPLSDKTIDDTIAYARKIVESVLMDNNFTYKLTDYKMNTAVNEHTVRTATYAVALAKAYNDNLVNLSYSEKQEKTISLENIAIAALLHDVGKLCKNDNVRYGVKDYVYLGSKYTGLPVDKFKKLKEEYDPEFDSYYGYNIIHDHRSIPTEAKVMVLFSGENNIGTGPLKPSHIRLENSTDKHIVAAKMINLCSHFDEYMMENINEEITLENAYEEFRTLFTNRMFEDSYLNLFIKTIPLYPPGTKVLLHGTISGYAIVLDTYKDETNYSRPVVVTIPGKKHVDLSKERDTTIKQVIGDEVKMYELLKKNTVIAEEEEEYKKAI